MSLKKDNAVEDFRKLIGSTDPEKAEEGTIRKLYVTSIELMLFMDLILMIMPKLKVTFFFKS